MPVLFNKPFRVMSQFRASGDKTTLAQFFADPLLRVAGRLDYDSEGLLILTSDGRQQQRITHPRYKLPKTYVAQVEGIPTDEALEQLRRGIRLNDGLTQPARVERISQPAWLWPRVPSVRYRASIPDSWLQITISEGRNRQIRRMTAAVGYPTLRLIRTRVGSWTLDRLAPGEWRAVDKPL